MAIFTCKMCGGEISFEKGVTTAECPFCGVYQTLPKIEDDRRSNLYDRAGHFRRTHEYDKAMALYETILQEDRSDAEAYWSLVLCKYGIEYVTDPATGKQVPTVNRTQYASVLADEDYQSALEYADESQKELYRREAEAIDGIQKNILLISEKEEPFDVFICYKETDKDGRRTPDSVLANDLYHQLTAEGYKVFFSRITLEDKIGSAYEPYIFAALNSARVMVVLGTKPEHFRAAWVKNEWSRYLALIRAGAEKTLVPAYRDMDPYDLPEEFSHLQAQDMSKLGFMQDLLRGIKKLAGSVHQAAPVQQPAPVQAPAPVQKAEINLKNLIDRAMISIEDGDNKRANEFIEKVLNEDAQYSRAYIAKLLIELRLRRESELCETEKTYSDRINWQRAVKFASAEEQALYRSYLEKWGEAKRSRPLEESYQRAIELSAHPETADPANLMNAAAIFEQLSLYKDSQKRAQECRNLALKRRYESAEKQQSEAKTPEDYEKASASFRQIGGYLDAEERAKACYDHAMSIRYNAASRLLSDANTPGGCLDAKAAFLELKGWRDSTEMARKCDVQAKRIRLNRAVEDLRLAESVYACDICIAELKDLSSSFEDCDEWLKKAEEKREQLLQKRRRAQKKFAKITAYIAAALSVVLIIVWLGNLFVVPYFRYKGILSEISEDGSERAEALALTAKDQTELIRFLERIPFYASGEQLAQKLREAHAEEAAAHAGKITATEDSLVGIKSDGTVFEIMDYKYSNQTPVKDKTQIVAVDSNDSDILMLKSDGTVSQTNRKSNAKWTTADLTGIASIAASSFDAAGVKADGSVVLMDSMSYVSPADVSDWQDMVSLVVNSDCLAGLRSDGTVKVDGFNRARGNQQWTDVPEWTDIAAIAFTSSKRLAGIKTDGSVVVAKPVYSDEDEEISEWENIVSIKSGYSHTVGLRSDGTVVAVGDNDHGQLETSDWKNIVAIEAYGNRTFGLQRDGFIVVTGYYSEHLSEQLKKDEYRLFDESAEETYRSALTALNDGKWNEAEKLFQSIIGYKDANQYRMESIFRQAASLLDGGSFDEAKALFGAIPAYKGAADFCTECDYRKADSLLKNGEFDKAKQLFSSIPDYKDASDLAMECTYQKANSLLKNGEFDNAKQVFSTIPDYKDASDLAMECTYQKADLLFAQGNFDDAHAAFSSVSNHKDASERAMECIYQKALLTTEHQRTEAIHLYESIPGYRDADGKASSLRQAFAKDAAEYAYRLRANHINTMGVQISGTILKEGIEEFRALNTDGWENVVYVDAGIYHLTALLPDGTAVTAEREGRSTIDTGGWQNLTSIAAGGYHTLGLKKDGTVEVSGDIRVEKHDETTVNIETLMTPVREWTDIAAIDAGRIHSVGLKKDGTVVSAGDNSLGQLNTEEWTDIIAIACGGWHTVGLKSDGTVVSVGNNGDNQLATEEWTDIIAIAAGDYHTVGLKSDGTVIAAGSGGKDLHRGG